MIATEGKVVSEDHSHETKSWTFEEAISATRFGLFNILLLAVTAVWFTSSLAQTTMPGLILPVAQCDLELDLDRKGWVTSMVFFGMIFGASIWGILGDIYGRKIILTGGLFLLGLINFLYGFSTSYYMLVTLNFFGGIVASGPVAAYAVFVSEFHGVQYRARIVIFICTFISGGAIVIMALGLLILTKTISFTIGSMEFHSWQVFFWACSTFGFLGGLLAMMLPESPKFLMSQGRNEEALKVFQLIYRLNTRKSSDSYSINNLKDESQSNNVVHSVEAGEMGENNAPKNPSTIFRKAFAQFLPLFKPPYMKNCLLAGFIEFFMLFGTNTMRSWMPQMFALLSTADSSTESGLCESLTPKTGQILSRIFANESSEEVCKVLNDSSIYVNSIIVQSVGVFAVLLAVYLVTFIGNKIIIIGVNVIAGLATLLIYFAPNSVVIVVFYSLSVGLGMGGQASYASIVSNLVPTAIRFTVMSIAVTLGRLGSMVGNLVFPSLLKLGCWQPFGVMAFAYLLTAVLCCFLPKTTKKPLQ
ncbi:hypothetical protein DMENIID0001_002080 [Sergentomyia squamirostris]